MFFVIWASNCETNLDLTLIILHIKEIYKYYLTRNLQYMSYTVATIKLGMTLSLNRWFGALQSLKNH